MGFAITWCAVRKEHAEVLLRDLNLSLTDKKDDAPDSPVAVGELDTGWQILWINEYDCSVLNDGALRRLSMGYDLIVCKIEEHVMASSSELWSKGEQAWRISHAAETNLNGVEAQGHLPTCFVEVKAQLEHQRTNGDSEVDYMFDVPLVVAQRLVGFKHDEVCKHLVNRSFVVVTGLTLKRPFWRRFLR